MATTTKTPIGLALPIQDGNSGYFNQTYDTFTEKRMCLINLLRTRQGERRFQPTFGSRLWTVVFQQNADILGDVITNIIKEDVATWINNVVVKNVNISVPQTNGTPSDVDIYSVLITVTFQDVSSQQEGTIDILLNSGKV